MKTVTIENVLSFHPCWEDAKGRMEKIAQKYNRQEWTVLDILRLPVTLVSNADKLWLVLRHSLIDDPVLHEFACRCAERALSRVKNPDPRSVAAVAAKRAWLKGEITDRRLNEAYLAAIGAAAAADIAAGWAAYATAHAAAYADADSADWAASCAADAACWDDETSDDAVTERAWQVETLIKMLEVNDQL